MTETFITVQEAAEQLRIHPQTVRLWLREGKLRGRLIGGRKSGYRIPASEMQRLLSPVDQPFANQNSEADVSCPPRPRGRDAGQFRLGQGCGAEPLPQADERRQ